ncbi:hypothetical protein U1Q18_029802 [Sarracenia purpurea var. burkii]
MERLINQLVLVVYKVALDSIQRDFIGFSNRGSFEISESSDANVAAKRRKTIVGEIDKECSISAESKSCAANFGDSGELLEDSCLLSAKSDASVESSPLSLVKLTRNGLVLFTIPRNDSPDVVDIVSEVICSLESGILSSPL